eukprot:TRINITY_DN776_c0_g2_i2.p1 TRINITY_DN776_c0_g2~~TRINITY_DN776_c0_g2_i2.p1  ORF type:complete len:695 (+),score=149.93 TRINITY_DN776_c0_g2_i2:261-2345(+)
MIVLEKDCNFHSFSVVLVCINSIDGYIRLFSHTHMVGAGINDYGTIGVTSITHKPTSSDILDYGYQSSFSHSSEVAYPGYYSVVLRDYNIKVELTATEHVGVHRYTYNGNIEKYILFDISHALTPDACNKANITIDAKNNAVYGYILELGHMARRYGGYKSYFYAKFADGLSIANSSTWRNGQIFENTQFIEGCHSGASVEINGPNNVVEFYVGISSLSIDKAKQNLEAEIKVSKPGYQFDLVKSESVAIWEDVLSMVSVEGTDHDNLVKFYTALYRTHQSPTIFDEYGEYLGFDNMVHKLDKNGPKNYYSDMSIWDVHRTQFPWLVLSDPERMADIIKSLIIMYKEGGDLPKWPMANGYTGAMIGTHSIVLIADAYIKGVEDIDMDTAYKAMKQAATQKQQNAGRRDLVDWNKLGYIPWESSEKGACYTLAYSYDDGILANVAKKLGHMDDYELFTNTSKNYKNVFHPEEKFFCPKTREGKWECPPVWINVFDDRYTEGDAWHYRFNVGADPNGLIELFGSKQEFVKELETFCYRGEWYPFNILPNPYYWAGNEEDLLACWMFNFADRADLTQRYIRWLLDNKYTVNPDGIPGNDDYGTMSAWYIFGSLGFYPVAGTTQFIVGTPLFPKITVHRKAGDLTVISHNSGKDNFYVLKATINGKPIDMKSYAFIEWEDIKGEATLEFWMSNKATVY